MRIEGALDEDVRFVAQNMRAADLAEFTAVSHARTRDEIAGSLLDRYGGHPAAIVARDDAGKAVAIGAGVEGRPNVVTLLFFATDSFPQIALGLTRFIRQNLFLRYRQAGVHRIEAISMDGHAAAHRWLKTLGLQHEAELRGFGKNGETFHQFAWVRDDVRSIGA